MLWADRICTSRKLMEGVGQKKGDEQICLLRNAPSSCISDSRKSQQQRVSIAFHAIVTADERIMHISQNSSAFCGVRCVIARAVKIENYRSRREAFGADVRGVQMVKDCAAPGDMEETIPHLVMTTTFKFDDNLFCCVAASALLTKCTSLPMPRFRQTCGRKWRMPCGGDLQGAALLKQQQIIMIRRMA